MQENLLLIINEIENLIKYDDRFINNKEQKFKSKIKKLYLKKNKYNNNNNLSFEINHELFNNINGNDNKCNNDNDKGNDNSNKGNDNILKSITSISEKIKHLKIQQDKLSTLLKSF